MEPALRGFGWGFPPAPRVLPGEEGRERREAPPGTGTAAAGDGAGGCRGQEAERAGDGTRGGPVGLPFAPRELVSGAPASALCAGRTEMGLDAGGTVPEGPMCRN